MRIFIRDRNDSNLEADTRISKFNYGSCKNYSIENVIVEKRLMYKLVVRDAQEIMYTISDLKVCYNRQLPNLSYLVQELVGVERESEILFTKLFPVMN